MRRTTRRIVFYLLVFLFVLTGPIAVLYSLGYTFRFSTATFETTGGLFIKSDTPRMSLFLDGAFVKETGFITGSTLVTDVTPGTHVLRLEKQGFRPWTKTAVVAPTAVTEFRNVFLVPRDVVFATSTRAELARLSTTTTPLLMLSLDKKNRLIATERAGKTRVVAENVHSFSPTASGAIFVGQNGFLARFDAAGEEVESIGRPGFFFDREPFQFSVGTGGITAIIDSSGGLFLFDDATGTIRPVTAGVRETHFDTAGEKLLIVKDQTIDVMWIADNDRQPFQKAGTIETVVAIDDAIRGALWYYETEAHVVYRTRAGVFIAETDNRGGGNATELVTDPVDEIITSPLDPTAVFYREGKNMYRIAL